MELKAYKFRLYPTKEQEVILTQFFGAKRWVYNHYLGENRKRFLEKTKRLTAFDINKDLTILKGLEDTKWLKNMDSILLQNPAISRALPNLRHIFGDIFSLTLEV